MGFPQRPHQEGNAARGTWQAEGQDSISGAVLISDVAPASSRNRAARMAALRSNWHPISLAIESGLVLNCVS